MATTKEAAAEKSTARHAKFQLEFMLLMLTAGRGKEAQEALQKALELIDALIEAGH